MRIQSIDLSISITFWTLIPRVIKYSPNKKEYKFLIFSLLVSKRKKI